jgi:hypothetical protein
MKRIGAIMLVMIVLAIPGFADDFSTVVNRIESHYGVHRLLPRLIGFTLFLVKPAMWGSGVSGLKVAVFEEETRSLTPVITDLDSIMRMSLGPKWKPFVRVDSRRDGEATVIYADCSGKHVRMILASVEQHDIAIVQMKVGEKAFNRWSNNPAAEAKSGIHR